MKRRERIVGGEGTTVAWSLQLDLNGWMRARRETEKGDEVKG